MFFIRALPTLPSKANPVGAHALTSAVAVLTLLGILLCGPAADAERLVSRTDLDQDGNFIAQMVDVARLGNVVNVGSPITLGPPLPAGATIGPLLPVNSGRHIVYVAFTTDGGSFDDLFVVDVNAPSTSQVLNAPRVVGVDAPILFAGVLGSSRVAFALRNLTTGTDRLYVANVDTPGVNTLITDALPPGATIGDMEMSPDGRTLAYRVDRVGAEPELRMSFLSLPQNSQRIDLPVPSSNYSPSEFQFSANSRQFLWRSGVGVDAFGNFPPLRSEPLRMVTIAPGRREIGAAIQVNQGAAFDEQVFEFDIDKNSEQVFYRAIPAGSIGPGDTFAVTLASPGVATQLNPAAVAGAGFTNQEDVLIVGDSVLYNAAQANPNLVELFSTSTSGGQPARLLSGSVALATEGFSISEPGVSHMVASADESKVAVIDGDPARNLFVIDLNNTARTFAPFELAVGQTIERTTRTNLTRQDPFSFSPNSSLIAMLLDPPIGATGIAPAGLASGLLVALPDVNDSARQVFPGSTQSLAGLNWLADPTVLAAAILPTSRSGQVGSSLSAFVSIINGGAVAATDCALTLDTELPVEFNYQRTNPVTNAVIGFPNAPSDIAAGAVQSYVISAQILDAFAPVDSRFRFACANAENVAPFSGLNTLLLSGSVTPVPDVVALAATPTANGFLDVPGNTGSAAFAVATVNVGSAAALTAQVDTFSASLPVAVGICQTNATGACITAAPIADTVAFSAVAGGTSTFGVFVGSAGFVPESAAENRIRVVFRDASGAVRGQTSVAVRTSS